MKKLLTNIIVILSVMVTSSAMVLPATAYADAKTDVCEGIGIATGGSKDCKPQGGTSVDSAVKAAINILSIIVGIVSVIMIIIGGLKYVISSGDSGNIKGAKDTILYALIGLVIVALSQVIVRFVLDKATQPICQPGQTVQADGTCK
jgi:hypothetical protein